MSSSEKSNVLVAHWDWLVAGICFALLALAIVFFFVGGDPANAEAGGVARPRARANAGVTAVDKAPYEAAAKAFHAPGRIVEPSGTQGSYLASETRVFCQQGDPTDKRIACGRPIPFGSVKCPFCGVLQPKEEKPALDSDGDGMPDEWELKYGLDPKDPSNAQKDTDGDGFTDLEEYEAKTDPSDPSSHPDYLDFLTIEPPLKQTFLPFHFVSAREVPAGMKLDFKDPARTKEYDRGIYSVLVGAPIGKTGYVLKKYDRKVKKVPIKGSNVSREKDVSEAVVERTRDGKRVTLVVGVQQVPVETQVKLAYAREGGKTFTVVRGSEIALNGTAYCVKSIDKVGTAIHVGVENMQTKEIRILKQPLE
ncbi:MAG TPA: hypothetical protein DER26_07020 [Verrucomicrobia bacterium]|nr:hypothetical protein [Verrucomicrobiota bacterium]